MASTTPINLLLFCFFVFIISSHSTFAKTTSFKPQALLLPVTKDSLSLQYITTINQRTPLVPVELTVDLGGDDLWVDVDQGYVSSSYKPLPCKEWTDCKFQSARRCDFVADSFKPRPGYYNGTCSDFPVNPVAEVFATGELGGDVVTIQSTDGLNPGRVVSVPNFIFSAVGNFYAFTRYLAIGATGMAGLGRSKLSLPSQFSAAFGFPRKFAICLPSQGKGVVFFGDGPYPLLPDIDVSKSLTYTPLILNKVNRVTLNSEDGPSTEYFVGVKSIQINGKDLIYLNTSLLSIDKHGSGGTKISTVTPYTVLEKSIYNALIYAFSNELAGVPTVNAVKPFGLCYNGTKIGATRVGPAVPEIDLVLQNNVTWKIFGANSMVRVRDDVLCLGFVDGGFIVESSDFYDAGLRTSVVIGGHQLENNLFQFDLKAKQLGFSSSLLFRQTTCSNFNFTSKP